MDMDISPIGSSSLLGRLLAKELPAGVAFTIYHLSTPPTKCAALFAALPNAKPERTFCESHFLNIAGDSGKKSGKSSGDHGEILVFALEVLVYSTASLTTIFVSKADSTGYLHLLRLPLGTPSPLKTIATTFLRYIVTGRRRSGIKCLVSLFARAQDQYLFPGSIENEGKHLLDDRGLIRWWCRVLEPLLDSSRVRQGGEESNQGQEGDWTTKAYIQVPGLDRGETRNLLAVPTSSHTVSRERWTVGHPLLLLSQPLSAPPRCLIPRFPDDPKARFVEELDDTLPEIANEAFSQSPSKRLTLGRWPGVKSLEQFWEAMEFRQECSSGRLVGFLWVLFAPAEPLSSSGSVDVEPVGTSTTCESKADDRRDSATWLQRPRADLHMGGSRKRTTSLQSPSGRLMAKDHARRVGSPLAKEFKRGRRKALSGPIITRQPRTKATAPRRGSSTRNGHGQYYSWPVESRGQVLLNQHDYNRVNEFLLRLDFANQEAAGMSSARWVEEVRGGSRSSWGEVVMGEKQVEAVTVPTIASREERPTLLSAGLLRKRPKEAPVT
ncbi:MAG: hypothetical protein M1823_000796 [Watsoniomyces obsoletus]|nr:MAG: hypothetical protein M1823_000796 [Watsoniomyces obsoletus]